VRSDDGESNVVGLGMAGQIARIADLLYRVPPPWFMIIVRWRAPLPAVWLEHPEMGPG
jgi:hypothetical protein